jgi:type IV pilus assembly protein PilQ
MRKHRIYVLAALTVAVIAAGVSWVPGATGQQAAQEPTWPDAYTFDPARQGELLDVVIADGDPGQAVVSLVGAGEFEYDAFVLDNPPRLVVDLPGVTSRLEMNHYRVGEAGVTRVRAGQFRQDPYPVSRVVFDLESAVPYHIDTSGDRVTVVFQTAHTDMPAVRTASAEPASPEPVEPEPVERAEVEPAVVEVAVADEPPASPEPAEEPSAEPVRVQVAEVETPSAYAEPEPEPEPVVIAAAAEPAEEIVATEPALVEVAPVEAEPAEIAAPGPEPVEPAKPANSFGNYDTTKIAVTPTPEPAKVEQASASRSVAPETLEEILRAPELAAEGQGGKTRTNPMSASSFQTKQITADARQYTGKRISLNLVDADVKQVFRLFHEISGLNFVLDPTVEGRVTIVLDNVPWDQALDLILKNNGLDKTLDNNVVRIAPTRKLAAEAAERKQLKEAKELEVDPVTITRTLSYAKAKEVERVIRDSGVLTPRGKVIVDERTNTLIISDIPKRAAPVDELITTLDTETPQVMIEARIVETAREFVQDFGVDWGFTALASAEAGTSPGLSFPRNTAIEYDLNLPAQDASVLSFSFGNILDSFTLDIALDALEIEGRARILSSPKVATQNNERAEIEQGVRIPVVNTTATEINVEYVSASLRLMVTPQITADGTVILDIEVENNTPDFVNRVGDVPPINTQRAKTKVLIADGGTTVIGGIFTVNEGQSEAGVPWFRNIPVFGWLFKKRNITNENRELLIFITPKIMKIA